MALLRRFALVRSVLVLASASLGFTSLAGCESAPQCVIDTDCPDLASRCVESACVPIGEVRDAGPRADAGARDGGPPRDAGPPRDGGAQDTGPAGDSGASEDAGADDAGTDAGLATM